MNVAEIREKFAIGLEGHFVANNVPVAAVYDYQPASIDGSPVVLVLDEGFARKFMGVGTQTYELTAYLELHILVAAANTPLSEREQEIQVNVIEEQIAEYVRNYQNTNDWRALRYALDKGNPRLKIRYADGKPYNLQIIHLEIRRRE